MSLKTSSTLNNDNFSWALISDFNFVGKLTALHFLLGRVNPCKVRNISLTFLVFVYDRFVWTCFIHCSRWDLCHCHSVVPHVSNVGFKIRLFLSIRSFPVAPDNLVNMKFEIWQRTTWLLTVFWKYDLPWLHDFHSHAVLSKPYFKRRLVFQLGRSTSLSLR